jgi:hypothetical protein
MNRCIARKADGTVCGAEAALVDPQLGGHVCQLHSPLLRLHSEANRSYPTTRAYLGKVEEYLIQAGESARKEINRSDKDGVSKLLQKINQTEKDVVSKLLQMRIDLRKIQRLIE